MTSSVKVSAHCSDNKEVVVTVINSQTLQVLEEFVLQDGDVLEVLIYDVRSVASTERLKA